MIAASIADAIKALEAMLSAPRALPCPGCPAGNAIEHIAGRIEAGIDGAVRFWKCSGCGAERALDFVAIPVVCGGGESC